jgi:hypothetical protein
MEYGMGVKGQAELSSEPSSCPGVFEAVKGSWSKDWWAHRTRQWFAVNLRAAKELHRVLPAAAGRGRMV